MFNPFRKKDKSKDPTPAWVKWLVLAFVVYALVAAPKHEKSSPVSEEDAKPARGSRITEFKEKILPKSFLRFEDDPAGLGDPAVCGQDVTVAYKVFSTGGTLLETVKSETFRLGAGKAIPVLDHGVIGLKKAGTRRVTASADYAGRTEDAVFEVELLSAAPKLPGTNLRIFDAKMGNGKAIVCGQPAKVQVMIFDVNDKMLWPGKDAMEFTPGKSEVFLGLEQGVIGMRAGGERTLIVPPAFQKPLRGNKPTPDMGLPAVQTVIVDVKAQ